MKILNRDKDGHLALGLATTLAVFMLLTAGAFIAGMVLKAGLLMAFLLVGRLVAGVVAWLKEGYDEAHPEKHTKDLLDGKVTEAGANLASALILLWIVGVTL